jgi:hypothetical protein
MIKRRPPKEQFTPAALVAFKRMRELENECTCALSADPLNRCAACDEWWAQHSLVVTAAAIKPACALLPLQAGPAGQMKVHL